ncbi:CP4-6 prophage protein [Escherichia coli]|nr:CP4-6 prophage protein [Escherichia coli]
MTRLASRFGAVNLVRRDRPLTRDELAHYVPSVFSEENMNPAVTGTPISRLFPC